MATKKGPQSKGAKKGVDQSGPARTSNKRGGSAQKGAAGAASKSVLVWEDDPMSGLQPISRPVPKLSAAPFGTQITETAPPAKVYNTGTSEFRYWAAAEALRRAADFWGGILPSKAMWQGRRKILPVTLDRGVDLNAYYDRTGLFFFHDSIAGHTIYSGESPDVVCHEFGHAILDSVRPQLWDVAGVEPAAFHESFGDMSALLCALQLPTVRSSVLAETGGRLYRNSRVSRLAEQLGWAIRQAHPEAVDPDSLRNAVNSFFYRDPHNLPPNAPANLLSTEPHSFSRVFTAGFLEALSGMLLSTSKSPTERDILTVTHDAGRFLIQAIVNAPIVPDYYSQVAAHMIEADDKGMYKDAIKSAFVRRGILSLKSAVLASSAEPPVSKRRGIASMTPVAGEKGGAAPVPQVPLSVSDYGLNFQSLIVASPGQTKRLAVRAAAYDAGSVTPPSEELAAKSFVEDLFRRGRIELEVRKGGEDITMHNFVRKTHQLKSQDDGTIKLLRRTFDCGFDVL